MITTRFAPSPTGFLHLGHAYAALHAADPVRVAGRFLLRIEDIDQIRCRPDYTEALLEDLAWLGLHWEEPVRIQSHHHDDYAACLQRLRDRGLLYPCFCSRAEIAASATAPHDPTEAPVYGGACRTLDPALRRDRLARGDPHAWRLDTAGALRTIGPLTWRDAGDPVTARPGRFGDVVLARKDVPASYHLCVTHDDAHGGVTLVTRGEDLRAVTDIHRLLQALMDWPTPDYRFHPLLRGENGRRLSKRDGATSLRTMRDAGMTANDLRHRLGFPPA